MSTQGSAVQGPKHHAGITMKVTKCPRIDCPDPTLYVARRRRSSRNNKLQQRYHCIGCWRKFTQGGQLRVAPIRRPSKRWLRLYSPRKLNGPPPPLVHKKIRVRRPKTPRQVSSLSSEHDLIPIARYPGANYVAGAQSKADTLDAATPDLLGIDDPILNEVEDIDFPVVDYSLYKSDIIHDHDEDCESIGSTMDEHVIRAVRFTDFGVVYNLCSGGGMCTLTWSSIDHQRVAVNQPDQSSARGGNVVKSGWEL